ncbi:hypothetical protein FHS57_000615 [Runella defluvii]|uniref:ABC-three component systems C-terminal domain-containing protein n=1 Tax=Runella defluvii TaxID=370973 RepID=A0A7W5ZGY3_9BACT|nr:ABC-three component system protein [Runella defluvii]MBB3836633.1 hypothetical protein [Runella defluvii]
MDYRLENLSEDDFEELVNVLCQKVLGTATVAFTKGRDGGRDGRFTGKANNYPSLSEPWSGKFIIQAKHTNDYQASCSDNPFFGNKTSIINGEIANIKALIENGEVDNYLIFTNRKETESREKAVQYIQAETGLKNVDIKGKDTIHTWLRQYDDVAKTFKIGLYALPLVITEFDIKDTILAFSNSINAIRRIAILTDENAIINISKVRKNEINNLSTEYYENQIRRKSQQYFEDIDEFLSNFNNQEYAKIYYNFAEEMSNKIEIKRSTFGKFEEIFMYLYDTIFDANQIELKQDRRLIWIFLHHLYFNCHIGRTL